MAAYGLYTHIQSNKRRSIALLIGLFFLVYVMVFAGALLAEALIRTMHRSTISSARRNTISQGGAIRHHRHGDLDRNRLQISPADDRCRHRRAAGDPKGRAAAL